MHYVLFSVVMLNKVCLSASIFDKLFVTLSPSGDTTEASQGLDDAFPWYPTFHTRSTHRPYKTLFPPEFYTTIQSFEYDATPVYKLPPYLNLSYYLKF